jgi:MFS family permease
VHTLPFAGAVMVTAPMSSKLVDRFGTKRVVAFGLASFSVGMLVAAGTTMSSGYGRVVLTMVLLGGGMGLAQAPATESIMGALPREKAGVGSAVNDTTRELGGALGVAIIGSILSSLYDGRLVDRVGTQVPPPALDAAKDSVGSALAVAGQIGGEPGNALANAAREAFVHGMTQAALVTAAVAAIGAIVAMKWLPARAHEDEAVATTIDADLVESDRDEPVAVG